MKCYLCNNTTEKFIEKNGYQLYKCTSCNLICYDFKTSYQDFLKKQYSKGYFTGDSALRSYTDYGRDRTNIVKNMKWYMKQIATYKQGGTFLDIGCAYGYAMETAHDAGFDVYGIDPSEYAVRQAKKMFPKTVWQTDLSNMKVKDSFFDVVTMFDVFEHLQNPREDLKMVKNKLKKDGLLVIATGDTSSLWATISGRRWTFYNPPQHIYYFNKENIREILKQAGFEIQEIKTAGKWLSLPYVLHLAETVGESPIASKLSPLLNRYPINTISVYLKMHDNMVVFARQI